jgi:hypothetical protein
MSIASVAILICVYWVALGGLSARFSTDRAMFRVQRRGGHSTISTWLALAGFVLLVLGLPGPILAVSPTTVATILVIATVLLMVAPRPTKAVLGLAGFLGAMTAIVQMHGAAAGLLSLVLIMLLTWVAGLFRGTA